MKITNSAKSCRMARQNTRYNLKTLKTTQQSKFTRETGLKPEKKLVKSAKLGQKLHIGTVYQHSASD